MGKQFPSEMRKQIPQGGRSSKVEKRYGVQSEHRPLKDRKERCTGRNRMREVGQELVPKTI